MVRRGASGAFTWFLPMNQVYMRNNCISLIKCIAFWSDFCLCEFVFLIDTAFVSFDHHCDLCICNADATIYHFMLLLFWNLLQLIFNSLNILDIEHRSTIFDRKNYRALHCSFGVLREMFREYIFTHDYSRPELSLSSSSSVLLKLTKTDLILSVHFLSQRNERRAICLISWDPDEIAIMKYW